MSRECSVRKVDFHKRELVSLFWFQMFDVLLYRRHGSLAQRDSAAPKAADTLWLMGEYL